MVNPLSSGTALPATGQPPTQFERPAVPPNPAVQVTQAEQASLQGNAANSQESGPGNGNKGQSPENPLEKVNKAMEAWSTGMRFEMDEDAQRLVVSIVDNETGEVLRKVPSDAVLQVAKMIVQMQGGGVNTKA
jgi:flagellar protein FlaG